MLLLIVYLIHPKSFKLCHYYLSSDEHLVNDIFLTYYGIVNNYNTEHYLKF